MITGINHITISVSNLNRSFEFYTHLLGFKPIAKWEKGAYLTIGDLWFCLFHDDQTRTATLPEYTHIAFSVAGSEFHSICKTLMKAGVKKWQENSSEGESLYILDPDGYKLELHVGDLESRIASARTTPFKGMTFYS